MVVYLKKEDKEFLTNHIRANSPNVSQSEINVYLNNISAYGSPRSQYNNGISFFRRFSPSCLNMVGVKALIEKMEEVTLYQEKEKTRFKLWDDMDTNILLSVALSLRATTEWGVINDVPSGRKNIALIPKMLPNGGFIGLNEVRLIDPSNTNVNTDMYHIVNNPHEKELITEIAEKSLLKCEQKLISAFKKQINQSIKK